MEKEKKASIEDELDTRTFYCGICTEYKLMSTRFRSQGCCHYFCFSCITDHIGNRILRGDIPVRCPQLGCTIGELTYEAWNEHIEGNVHDAWLVAISKEKDAFFAIGGGRCSDCGSFLSTVDAQEKYATADKCPETMHHLIFKHGWRPCTCCGILIEKIGGCSIVMCRWASYSCCYFCNSILL
ncbi:hypothetical protein C2845_PM01G27150 [Panicum miliaceum]|uniref:RING-type domain-containing protein n=1 Tax=Panicum miliaceum TaxID=4540 RepID=A0A3L6TMH3_PANMI|nr:hypothetical protein C2845_PM01G27150 [Panicum miliaceum]